MNIVQLTRKEKQQVWALHQAEASAFFFGLKYNAAWGNSLIIVETESLLLQNYITGTWSTQWIISIVQEIMNIKEMHI